MRQEKVDCSDFLNTILVKDLQDDEIICPTCKGYGVVIDNNVYGLGEKGKPYFPYKHQSIRFCPDCYNGVADVCEFCGKVLPKTSHKCDCEGYKKSKLEETQKKLKNAYDKAAKVSLKDYDGSFIIGDNVIDKEEFKDKYWDEFNPETSQKWVWGCESENCFGGVDLQEIVRERCEDGYEDMHTFLDTKSSLLVQAQSLIDKWELENENQMLSYYVTNTIVVELDDLYSECLESLRKER